MTTELIHTCTGDTLREKQHRYWGWTANVIDAMFFFQKEHCYNSWLEEVNRQQSHPSTRRNSL